MLTERITAGPIAGLSLALALALVLVLALASPAVAVSGFADVPDASPYHGAISDLASRGTISGYGGGDFRPDDPVTRQQFAKMIVKTLGLTVTGHEVAPFTDVAKASAGASDPFYPDKYVAICYERGWIGAKTATTFGPLDDLSRAELIAIVARAASLPDPPAAYSPPFPNSANFSADYYSWARKSSYAGLLANLRGIGPDFDFLQDASRAESAQVLDNMVLRAESQSTSSTGPTSTSSETLPAAQSGSDTSVQTGSSTATSTPVDSQGAERGFAIAYLVVGICLAVLIALAVVVFRFRRARSRRRPSPEDSADGSAPENDPHEEVGDVLRAWAEAPQTLPALRAAGEGSEREELWDDLMESARETEASAGLSADEPEDAD